MGSEFLSPAGMARRESMLVELDAAMRRRNIRRVAVRSIAAAAPLVLIAAVIWGRCNTPSAPGTTPVAQAPGPAPASFVRLVQTDPDIVRRMTVVDARPRVDLISDDELQSLLASLGRPTGLVRTQGRVTLVSDFTPPVKEEDQKGAAPGASS